MYTVSQVVVPFSGVGSGVGGLTWGQVGFWQGMVNTGQSATMGGVAPLSSGTTVDQVADGLGRAVGRHQALRTRLRFTGDRYRPLQVCSASGEVVLDVVDVTGEDPAAVAERWRIGYEEKNFDYEREWPVRMAVVRTGGVPTHVVAVYLHLAVDAGALDVLLADDTPVTALQPLEQAAQQRLPAARRACDSSLRYLERVLRTVSTSRFGPPKYGDTRAFRMIRYSSPATALAIPVVATREATNTSSVLLACFAVGLARCTGNNPVLAMLLVSNRFRPGFGLSVSPVVQMSPYLIDVAGVSLREAVGRAKASVLNTYKNAYYDPYLQDEVMARVNAERGADVDWSCFYNDRRQGDRAARPGPLPTADEIRAAVPKATFDWEYEPDIPPRKLYCNVDDAPGAIDFVMSVDTRYFDEQDTVDVVRAVETVAVQAALDPSTPTGVGAPLAALS